MYISKYIYLYRAFRLFAIGRSRAFAAGAMWTNRTSSAPWAGRDGHTSVVDAAGAIYVIGGDGINGPVNDVLKSADGGADRTRGVLRGILGGYSVISAAYSPR